MSVILDGRFDRTNVNERTEKGSRESRGATLVRRECVDPDYVPASTWFR